MNTSQPTTSLSKPAGDDEIPNGTFAYFRSRNRGRIYDVVLKEFLGSGISQATLARRMAKRPEQINRLLGAPGNWTLDTVSDLLFAISGAEAAYGAQYPLDGQKRNYRQPEWLAPIAHSTAATTVSTFAPLQGGVTASGSSGITFRTAG